MFVPGGTTAGAAVYAVEGGTVVHNGSAVRRDGSPNGQSLTLRGTSGQQYWYGHIENPSPVGTTVQAGSQIAVVSANHEAPHLHIGFENKAVGTTVTVAAAALSGTGSPGTGGGIGGAGGVTGTTPTTQNQLTPGAVADIARQTFFTLQTGAFDLLESNLLRGERAIANDVSLLQWLGTIVNGAGRVFTSDALGNFRAFFPDYFGYYGSNNNGQTPTFFISEIEILDLTIQQSDNDLTTHVFGVGPILSGGTGLSIYDKLLSTVASVEKPAFRWFLTIDEETDFDPAKFLKKYGARPYTHEMPLVGKRELIWMGSWMKFLEL